MPIGFGPWGHENINPGKAFILTQPLEQVTESRDVMNERNTIRPLLRP